MSGETSLSTMLASLSPQLNPGEYVFCCVAADSLPNASAIASFREQEGLTLILPRAEAERLQLSYDYVAAWISLTVHSSLSALGLTAAFAGALAKAGISCNVLAAYYHDHLFVAQADAAQAMQVLQQLALRQHEG